MINSFCPVMKILRMNYLYDILSIINYEED